MGEDFGSIVYGFEIGGNANELKNNEVVMVIVSSNDVSMEWWDLINVFALF